MFGSKQTTSSVVEAARQAASDGRRVFAAEVAVKDKVRKGPEQDLPHLAEIIEGIEAEGWHLDRFEVAVTPAEVSGWGSGSAWAYLLFRR